MLNPKGIDAARLKVAVTFTNDELLGRAYLNRATGEHPMDMFDRLLGGPLQILHQAWFLSPSRQPYC